MPFGFISHVFTSSHCRGEICGPLYGYQVQIILCQNEIACLFVFSIFAGSSINYFGYYDNEVKGKHRAFQLDKNGHSNFFNTNQGKRESTNEGITAPPFLFLATSHSLSPFLPLLKGNNDEKHHPQTSPRNIIHIQWWWNLNFYWIEILWIL